jgi:hypothetical protein
VSVMEERQPKEIGLREELDFEQEDFGFENL